MPRHATPFTFWRDWMLAGQATATTLALRSLRVPFALATGDGWGKAEMARMVSEKTAAAQAGMVALWWATPSLMAAAMGGHAARSALVLRGSALASAPARRTVRANARRLSRPPTSYSRRRKRLRSK